MNKAKTTKKALDLFKWNEPVKNEAGDITREGWYSFKLEAIKAKGELYNQLSDIIHEADVDQNTAYDWTVEALEAISEILGYEPDINEDDFSDQLSSHADSNTPVYTSELVKWIGEGTNWMLVDDAISEMGKADSLTQDIMGAYCMGWERHARAVMEAIF